MNDQNKNEHMFENSVDKNERAFYNCSCKQHKRPIGYTEMLAHH